MKKKQTIRNVSSVPNSREINLKLSKLKIKIIQELNAAFLNGEDADKEWLKICIDNFFKNTANSKEK
jgi:hypothetical protein